MGAWEAARDARAIIENSIASLVRARGNAGGHAAADRLLPLLRDASPRLRPPADWRAIAAALRPAIATAHTFRRQVEAAHARQLTELAALFWSEGRVAAWRETMLQYGALTLVQTLDTPQAARDPARLAAADRTVDALLPMVAQLRASPSEAVPPAERMIAEYRAMRRASDDLLHHESWNRNA